MAKPNRSTISRKARLTQATARGREAAVQALRRRAAIRRAKKRAAPPRRAERRVPPPAIPLRTQRALAGPPPVRLVVAEGDSWFDYPFNDVLSRLEDVHNFDVRHVAHMGDTVESMAFRDGEFDDFIKLLEKLLQDGHVPDAVLISGGGNDIAGGEFAMLLNHARSGLPAVNADVLHGVVDIRIRNAYTYLIAGLTKIANEYLGRPIPIVLHGYDYAVPDGRGVLGGGWILPGPWLRPSLHRKGHGDLETNKTIIADLINALNEMLASLAVGHVRFVDLRGTLETGTGYKTDWANEIHPTKKGFGLVAAKIAAAV